MAVNWTKEQEQVINLRNRNILVSAAAGSGKTAVLVQRILKKVMDPEHPVDIDRLLIMTFTRAAAGEMRERIANALEDALCENPDNEHLQRQTTLIHTAQINHDRWLLCLCDPQLFPSYWSGSWLSDRRRGRIEASERGRDEGASGELLHKR